MLILVGHDSKNYLLQINITNDTTSIAHQIKGFWIIMVSLYITIAYCILIALQY